MNVNYNDYASHVGDNFEGDKKVSNHISRQDMEKLIVAVKEGGITKDDIDHLIQVLNNINLVQNDITNEFAKMSEQMKVSPEKGAKISVLKGVSLTSDMVTFGQAAIGIATSNPGLALPAVLETAKKTFEIGRLFMNDKPADMTISYSGNAQHIGDNIGRDKNEYYYFCNTTSTDKPKKQYTNKRLLVPFTKEL